MTSGEIVELFRRLVEWRHVEMVQGSATPGRASKGRKSSLACEKSQNFSWVECQGDQWQCQLIIDMRHHS